MRSEEAVAAAPDEPGVDAAVSLREITAATLRSVLALAVRPGQEQFVASNAVSIAQAHFHEHAWFRAIYADQSPVGFVMLHDEPAKSEYYLWRYMIDGRQQGKGYGRRALEQLIEHVRTRPGATELRLSYVPADGGARDFSAKLGFVETGEEHDGEREMRLRL